MGKNGQEGDAAMDRADGERGARAAGDAEAAEVRPAPPPKKEFTD